MDCIDASILWCTFLYFFIFIRAGKFICEIKVYNHRSQTCFPVLFKVSYLMYDLLLSPFFAMHHLHHVCVHFIFYFFFLLDWGFENS